MAERTSRDEWLRWVAGVVVQVVLASVSTGITNYFVMQVQVARLEERLEGQRALWDAQHRDLRDQINELRDELKELRALRRAAQHAALGGDLGASIPPADCPAILDVSPYVSSLENRRKSLRINLIRAGPS